ncbi:hypothetical protein A374_16103 [Fictibacillus macauensis ZFHKF-1]|uniref:Lipoprotein n=1 Tax=Fictibacillus macauensis ZFHKF-1 TaxID=1196324 RepID=I8UBK8_9BACL|nr:hypothetical protein [Fictibacillus macauensis]EIT84325.1 hypothetical protein A374_16103 [Fictibacillus macauensis ZFHKF-1]
MKRLASLGMMVGCVLLTVGCSSESSSGSPQKKGDVYVKVNATNINASPGKHVEKIFKFRDDVKQQKKASLTIDIEDTDATIYHNSLTFDGKRLKFKDDSKYNIHGKTYDCKGIAINDSTISATGCKDVKYDPLVAIILQHDLQLGEIEAKKGDKK